MGKNTSNYLKRQGQRSVDFIESRTVIGPLYNDLDVVQKCYVYEAQITPRQIIEKKNVYDIVHIDPIWIINGFVIITENDKVTRIIVFGHHPNVSKNIYCLPKEKKGQLFNKTFYENFIQTIQTYYYDNCYYKVPPANIKYKKIKSMFVKLNQG